MLNHIDLMGRLTADPVLRYTQTNKPVASFRLAVNRDFVEGTDFIDVVAWNKTADFVSKYFFKGSVAVVSGRLQMRGWTDREGNKRTSAEVVADAVYFGDSKSKAETRTATAPKDIPADDWEDIDDGPLPWEE